MTEYAHLEKAPPTPFERRYLPELVDPDPVRVSQDEPDDALKSAVNPNTFKLVVAGGVIVVVAIAPMSVMWAVFVALLEILAVCAWQWYTTQQDQARLKAEDDARMLQVVKEKEEYEKRLAEDEQKEILVVKKGFYNSECTFIPGVELDHQGTVTSRPEVPAAVKAKDPNDHYGGWATWTFVDHTSFDPEKETNPSLHVNYGPFPWPRLPMSSRTKNEYFKITDVKMAHVENDHLVLLLSKSQVDTSSSSSSSSSSKDGKQDPNKQTNLNYELKIKFDGATVYSFCSYFERLCATSPHYPALAAVGRFTRLQGLYKSRQPMYQRLDSDLNALEEKTMADQGSGAARNALIKDKRDKLAKFYPVQSDLHRAASQTRLLIHRIHTDLAFKSLETFQERDRQHCRVMEEMLMKNTLDLGDLKQRKSFCADLVSAGAEAAKQSEEEYGRLKKSQKKVRACQKWINTVGRTRATSDELRFHIDGLNSDLKCLLNAIAIMKKSRQEFQAAQLQYNKKPNPTLQVVSMLAKYGLQPLEAEIKKQITEFQDHELSVVGLADQAEEDRWEQAKATILGAVDLEYSVEPEIERCDGILRQWQSAVNWLQEYQCLEPHRRFEQQVLTSTLLAKRKKLLTTEIVEKLNQAKIANAALSISSDVPTREKAQIPKANITTLLQYCKKLDTRLDRALKASEWRIVLALKTGVSHLETEILELDARRGVEYDKAAEQEFKEQQEACRTLYKYLADEKTHRDTSFKATLRRCGRKPPAKPSTPPPVVNTDPLAGGARRASQPFINDSIVDSTTTTTTIDDPFAPTAPPLYTDADVPPPIPPPTTTIPPIPIPTPVAPVTAAPPPAPIVPPPPLPTTSLPPPPLPPVGPPPSLYPDLGQPARAGGSAAANISGPLPPPIPQPSAPKGAPAPPPPPPGPPAMLDAPRPPPTAPGAPATAPRATAPAKPQISSQPSNLMDAIRNRQGTLRHVDLSAPKQTPHASSSSAPQDLTSMLAAVIQARGRQLGDHANDDEDDSGLFD